MLSKEYECLLQQHSGNLTSRGSLEARPFTTELPPPGGLPVLSSDLSSIMATPAKRVSGSLL
jgi:hypothetical protein